MNPMLGDTGFALPVPASVAPMRYGALMRYMKLHHDATVLGISHCKNGRGMELNPVISTEVRGGMWLHLVGNNRILAEEVAWQEIEVPYDAIFQRLLGKTSAPAPVRGPLGLHLNAGFTLDTLAFRLLESSLLVALPGEKYTVAAASHRFRRRQSIFATTPLAMSFYKLTPLAARMLTTLMTSNFLYMRKVSVLTRNVTGVQPLRQRQ